jgi:hypothetical protein
MNIIPFLKLASFTETVILDNIVYKLRFDWNDRGQYWALSIFDSADNILTAGIKLVLNYPLTMDIIKTGLPPGVLMATESTGKMIRLSQDDFIDDKAFLGYITEAEATEIKAEV